MIHTDLLHKVSVYTYNTRTAPLAADRHLLFCFVILSDFDGVIFNNGKRYNLD